MIARSTRAFALAAVVLCVALVATPAAATSNHTYAPDEYALVAGGVSPDGSLAVLAHGDGDLGDENFALHLARRPGDERIGPLPGVADAFLDTDPAEYRAAWSPDSRHLAVTYRVDRHEIETLAWSVAGGRIEPLSGPDLFAAALKRRDEALEEGRVAGLRTLAWTGNDRFVLTDTRVYRVKFASRPKLGDFGRLTERLPEGGALVTFSARAECELTGPATWKIRSLGPGDFRR